MDSQGIDAAVLFPSQALFVPFLPEFDVEASAKACRAYNDWIAEYCATDPTRLTAVGAVPVIDPQRAADEARYLASLGLAGVFVRPNFLYDRNLGDPAYDPLYEAIVETGLVLGVHEALGLRGVHTIGSDRFDGFGLRHAHSHAMEQMASAASMLLEGALERHPELRVAFLESGTGWLPYWLDRLDDHFEWMHDTEYRELSMRPSEYFLRQCVISSDPEDRLAGWAADRVGADHVMWGSDFPHPDATFPGAVNEFVADSGLDEPGLRAVLWETPMRFYRLEGRFTRPADELASSGSAT
jgi:predicted TIM-barrel fold metal-dependent hydrolase